MDPIYICEFAYFLQFIGNSRVSAHSAFLVIADVCRVAKRVGCLMCTFPAEVQQGDAAFLFQLPSCKQVSFFVVYLVLFVRDFTVSDGSLASGCHAASCSQVREGCHMPYGGNVCWTSSVQARAIVPVVLSSVNEPAVYIT